MIKKHKQRFEHCVVTPVYDQGKTEIDYIQEKEKIGWELVVVARGIESSHGLVSCPAHSFGEVDSK